MSEHDVDMDWLEDVNAMANRFAKTAAELCDEVRATADEVQERGNLIDEMLRSSSGKIRQARQDDANNVPPGLLDTPTPELAGSGG